MKVTPGDSRFAAGGSEDMRGSILRVSVSGRVFATAFSQSASGDRRDAFLALGMRASVMILRVSLAEDAEEEASAADRLDVQIWKEVSSVVPSGRHFLHVFLQINHDGRVQCQAWPFSDHPMSSAGLSLVTGGADGKVRVFRMNLHDDEEEEVQVQVLQGHTVQTLISYCQSSNNALIICRIL
jgi:hypothetical protein